MRSAKITVMFKAHRLYGRKKAVDSDGQAASVSHCWKIPWEKQHCLHANSSKWFSTGQNLQATSHSYAQFLLDILWARISEEFMTALFMLRRLLMVGNTSVLTCYSMPTIKATALWHCTNLHNHIRSNSKSFHHIHPLTILYALSWSFSNAQRHHCLQARVLNVFP